MEPVGCQHNLLSCSSLRSRPEDENLLCSLFCTLYAHIILTHLILGLCQSFLCVCACVVVLIYLSILSVPERCTINTWVLLPVSQGTWTKPACSICDKKFVFDVEKHSRQTQSFCQHKSSCVEKCIKKMDVSLFISHKKR